jgi:diguanylate cyclase (GGDEF)-like protein/PAS domain S-box-containing protein
MSAVREVEGARIDADEVPGNRATGSACEVIRMRHDGEADYQSLADMLNSLPERVVRYAVADRRIKYCNNSWAAARGRTPAELLGLSLDELLSPPELEGVAKQLALLGPDCVSLADSVARPAPEAPDRWIAWADQFLPGPDGGDVLAVGRDVTDEHVAKLALIQSEEGFRHLAERSADVVWRFVHSPSPHFTYLSPSIEKFTGYLPADLINDFGRFVSILEDHDSQALLGAVGLGPVGSGRSASDRYDLTFRRRDGALVVAEMQVTQLPDGSQGVGRDVTELRGLQAELTHLALRDPLTGLANRRLLDELLEAAIKRADRSGVLVAVIFLDLDNFKTVNDTYGHDVGDLVLRVTADRLRASVRDTDAVARVGGDEFVVVHESSGVTVDVITQRIQRALAAPIDVAGIGTLYCQASVGFAHAGVGARTASALLSAADSAMYVVKRARRVADPRAELSQSR